MDKPKIAGAGDPPRGWRCSCYISCCIVAIGVRSAQSARLVVGRDGVLVQLEDGLAVCAEAGAPFATVLG